MVILNWMPKIKITLKISYQYHILGLQMIIIFGLISTKLTRKCLCNVFWYVYCLRWDWLVSRCYLTEVFSTVTMLFPKAHYTDITCF